MSNMILHCGGQTITKADLDLIPLPPETETYKPVGHGELVGTIAKISQDLLTGYTLKSEQYALARNGAQLFGALTFSHNDFETGLTVGIRNSLDRSMSIGFCIGNNCFICDNLAFRGEITVLRKHTLHVWKNLEDLAISTLYRSNKQHIQLEEDFAGMKALELTHDHGFMVLGLLFGRDVLSPRQLATALEQWNNPKHAEFQPRNLFSLYNDCTEALKSSAPIDRMDRQIKLHNVITLERDQWN